MTDNSGSIPGQHSGQPGAEPHSDRDTAPARAGTHEQGHARPAGDVAKRLLVGYSHALDTLAAAPAIAFDQDTARGTWLRRLVPRANFLAEILAERHVADRVDALIRRALRLGVIDPARRYPLDLVQLREFRDSLSPVRRRTLALWVALFALAIAFPVAWVTDDVSAFAPEVIKCSSHFGVREFVAKALGTAVRPGTVGCHVGPRAGLVDVLVQMAHLNLSPGGVIDAFRSVRAGGMVSGALLAVVLILCVSTVLLVFRSGFRLKRRTFSGAPRAAAGPGFAHEPSISPEGLYDLERDVFAAVGLSGRHGPREFPLDLVVSAGLLVLPLTIAVALLNNAATLRKLGPATAAELAVVALTVIALVIGRLWRLARLWHNRGRASAKSPSPEDVAPNGTTVPARSGAYGMVLLAAFQIAWGIMAIGQPLSASDISIWFVRAPLLTWPLGVYWWYRLHRDLADLGDHHGLRLFRVPALSAVPPLSLASAWTIPYAPFNPLVIILTSTGALAMPFSVYHMGWKVSRLNGRLSRRKEWRAHLAGLLSAVLVILPACALFYFQRRLRRIRQRRPAPPPPGGGATAPVPIERPDASPLDPAQAG